MVYASRLIAAPFQISISTSEKYTLKSIERYLINSHGAQNRSFRGLDYLGIVQGVNW
jgi:hypothetical protein